MIRIEGTPHDGLYIAATEAQIEKVKAHQETIRGVIAGLLFRVGQLSDLEDAAYVREDSVMGNILLQRLGESMHAARVLARANGIYL